MRRNRLPPRLICFFMLLIGLLSSNTLADLLDGNGSLGLQVVAGAPEAFNDRSLPGGKYPAGNATVSIYHQNSDFLFEVYANEQGQLVIHDLPVGLIKYEILWGDFHGNWWKGEGSVSIEKDALVTKLVELKRESSALD